MVYGDEYGRESKADARKIQSKVGSGGPGSIGGNEKREFTLHGLNSAWAL